MRFACLHPVPVTTMRAPLAPAPPEPGPRALQQVSGIAQGDELVDGCPSSTPLRPPSPTCVAVLVLWGSPSRGHFPSVCSALPCAQTRPSLRSPPSAGKNQASQGQETCSLEGHRPPGDLSPSPCPPVSPRRLRLNPEGRGLWSASPRHGAGWRRQTADLDGRRGTSTEMNSVFLLKTFGNKTGFKLLTQLG